MRANQTLIEDLMALSGNMLGNLLNARHDLRASAKNRFGIIAQQLDLVSRNEFDAAFAMLAKARAMQEDLDGRLAKIEAKLNLSSKSKTKHSAKQNLPRFKKRNFHGKRA